MLRIRHRCGYGIHSPFAFGLLTQVLYNPGYYYAYARLDKQYTLRDRLLRPRRRAIDRLLFRLSNALQPRTLCMVGGSVRTLSYLQAGCTQARTVAPGCEPIDLIYVSNGGVEVLDYVAEGGAVVVDHLRCNKVLWRTILDDARFTVSFDLHDVGLALRRSDLARDSYRINW